jgi:hypothetical protein
MIYDGNTIEQKRQEVFDYFCPHYAKISEKLLIHRDHIKSLRDARIEEIYEEIEKNSYLLDDDQEDMEYFLCYDLEGSIYFDKNMILTPDERGDIEANVERMAEYVLNQDETLNFEGMSDDELLEYEADMKEAWDDLVDKHREG